MASVVVSYESFSDMGHYFSADTSTDLRCSVVALEIWPIMWTDATRSLSSNHLAQDICQNCLTFNGSYNARARHFIQYQWSGRVTRLPCCLNSRLALIKGEIECEIAALWWSCPHQTSIIPVSYSVKIKQIYWTFYVGIWFDLSGGGRVMC